jgi:hypothetical protein
MTSIRLNVRGLTTLAVALLVLAIAAPAPAGPISDMLARHRAAKATKLPPLDKPHTIKKIKDPYPPRTGSLAQKFKQRMAVRQAKATMEGKDPGIIKTSNH